MTKKQTILFFLSILVLIVSEYFLLRELFNEQRPWILVVGLLCTIVSVYTLVKLFKMYRSGAK